MNFKLKSLLVPLIPFALWGISYSPRKEEFDIKGLEKILKLNQVNEQILHLSESNYSTGFSFAVIGDSRPAGNEIYENLRRQIEDHHPDFIIHTGDFVSNAVPNQMTEYFKSIEDYTLPIFHVLGNHELQESFQDGDFKFDYKDSRFVLINNSHDEFYGLKDNQIVWLKDQLDDATPENKYVFMHVPPSKPFEWLQDDKVNPFRGEDEFLDLVNKFNVTMSAYGHRHYFATTLFEGSRYLISAGGGAPLYQTSPSSEKTIDSLYISNHHFVIVEHDSIEKVLDKIYVHFQNERILELQ